MKICTKCDKKHHAKGLCISHYAKQQRAYRKGKVVILTRGECLIEECYMEIHAKGMCEKHYREIHGEINKVKKGGHWLENIL